MPNTAMKAGQSMTCIAASNATQKDIQLVKKIFDAVGSTLLIKEELMSAATALCACGTAFFLRAIRAASQGGVEIGFHAEEAIHIAAQTALGAATLLLQSGRHPEAEIDKVTSPQGCTIAGLNEMEHQGFSSAMIKGIKLSASIAKGLYKS
jgi:pyrroline-5-carboxylate reductase